MNDAKPVLAIGVDAAELTLIDELCEAGRMPVLAELRERGRFGRIRSEAVHFMSSVWPTFYSSTPTGNHGWYYGKLWHPDRMRLEYGAESWLGQSPFWEGLDPGFQVAILDMPFVIRRPDALNGFFVSGWQTHDQLGLTSHPRGSRRELRRRFGRAAMRAERFGPQTPRSLLQLRREVLAGLEQTASIARWLLASRRWDLLLIVLGGVHRASHYLWDLSQIDESGLDSKTRATLEGAREEVYSAADRSLGAILEAAPEDAHVLIFALHGMRRNDGWADRFGSLVEAIRRGGAVSTPSDGILYRLRRRVPWRLTRPVTQRLPFSVTRRLLPLWSAGMHDWSETRFFALPCDVNGFLRVNLRGRESAGIVEPGREYEALLDELEGAFLSFRAIETGEPIVHQVVRADSIEAARGCRRRFLPDLILRWNRIASQDLSGVVSDAYGELRWEKGGPLPSGRSGNHSSTGWLVAVGPGIDAGPELECDTLDLVPTLLRWMGAESRAEFRGRPLPELIP